MFIKATHQIKFENARTLLDNAHQNEIVVNRNGRERERERQRERKRDRERESGRVCERDRGE